ncbi:fatty acid transporter [Histoplasma capsulatum G186AR]|uniref:Very long-chain fatty acid transport protein n=1 Tax=Ajellomyces capsulatus (strain G186AR / H82 / ATCC MYA-2454 / RMSCC 2432) TaxID=447093 RepID=C0NTL4_AJECG|nr:fatty acid transporter [Histoplasma capsulatum G186AR]EEH05375.1 fatty acid transporter [Histoplasma capsulatum G186AR]
MPLTKFAASVAGTLAAAAYLDAKYLLRHDLSGGSIAAQAKDAVQFLTECWKQDKTLMYHVLEAHARGKNQDNIFLIFEGRSWSYKQFFEDVHGVGNWLVKDLGVERGELVALDGGNSPEYLLLWFGLESIAACPSFINCNLTAAPLVHCVKLCGARYLLADRGTEHLVQVCEEELKEANIQTIYYDSELMSSFKDKTPTPDSRRTGIGTEDLASLIYTSGTAGLPKATNLIRRKELTTARAVCKHLDLKPGKKMYTCLPLYHGAAHGLCINPSIFAGSTVVLSRKFSHKTFWPEVCESQAEIIQYVGELCRYLVNAPHSPLDKKHNVKIAWGNGMRPDVWSVFRERFGIETINELYAATDGVSSSFNANKGDFGLGAIGVRGLYWKWVNGSNEKRVKIDVVTEEIQRDQDGFAIACEDGEPGKTLYKIDPAAPDAAFVGYFKNKGAGEKRKIRDVFQKGDMWFRSGDMMRQDPDGCLYFVDRLGDTFRWKSENVSTNEVSDVLGKFDNIDETNIYGVQVPHTDGRAGCAAIVLAESVTADSFDFGALVKYVIGVLPRYAVPIFVRVVPGFETTGTMKLQKGKLRAQGIDLDKIKENGTSDRLFWLPPDGSRYTPFEADQWEALKAGKIKL